MSETDPKASREHPGHRAALPVELAFVVRFREGMGAESGLFLGRVEHVSSGRTSSFQSPAELQDCIRASLREAEIKNPSDPAR